MATKTNQVPTSTLLAALGRDDTSRVRRAIGPLGLSTQQFIALSQLRLLGEASQTELADAAGIDRSNFGTIANDLCERGFVVRDRHERDRRRYVLRLSSSGEQLLRRCDGVIDAANDDLLGPLDDAQRAQLHALLRLLADGVELCPSDEDAV